jgi:hypothetical protein
MDLNHSTCIGKLTPRAVQTTPLICNPCRTEQPQPTPHQQEKVVLVKNLKAASIDWVAKYARGGSARTQSARKL